MTKKEKEAWEKARNYFISTGEIPDDETKWNYTLHHKDPTLKYSDPQRYKEWRVEDLVPLTRAQHCAIHGQTEERKQKISNTNKNKGIGKGEKNGMYGMGYLVSGAKNGMYGKVPHNKGKKMKIVDGKRVYYECD